MLNKLSNSFGVLKLFKRSCSRHLNQIISFFLSLLINNFIFRPSTNKPEFENCVQSNFVNQAGKFSVRVFFLGKVVKVSCSKIVLAHLYFKGDCFPMIKDVLRLFEKLPIPIPPVIRWLRSFILCRYMQAFHANAGYHHS